jgi:hypothetical protein
MTARIAPLLAAVVAAGCTTTYSPPEMLVPAYARAPRIDLAVCLVLDEELRTAAWSDRTVASMGVREEIPFGDALARAAEQMSRELFTSVTVVSDAAEVPAEAEATLTPRFAGAARTRPARSFDELRLSVVVEWWLRDREGRPIWVESIRGSGVAPVEGLIVNRNAATDRIRSALEQLFADAHRAIAESPELRAYVAEAKRTSAAQAPP